MRIQDEFKIATGVALGSLVIMGLVAIPSVQKDYQTYRSVEQGKRGIYEREELQRKEAVEQSQTAKTFAKNHVTDQDSILLKGYTLNPNTPPPTFWIEGISNPQKEITVVDQHGLCIGFTKDLVLYTKIEFKTVDPTIVHDANACGRF